jgi:hypothetical protein
MSHLSSLNQWVGPLVQFILPSLAFCLNIPRCRKLSIPEVVFQAHPRNLVGFASYWIRLLGAFLLMTIDTVVWLSICFAFAGPMLLSAVYEFVLDRKILEFLRPHKQCRERAIIPDRLKAQLLLSVVVGNLRISSSGGERRHSAVRHNSYGFDTEACGAEEPRNPHAANNSWKRVMTLLDDLDSPRPASDFPGVVSLPTKLKAILNSQERWVVY